jgi:cation diffusion facilitator CzcD-associated flavoprotein CzcO
MEITSFKMAKTDCPGSEAHFDVLIAGAGLSGIGAAAHLKRRCPRKSFAILEARKQLGGTWDLFRFPGIRSDSDMYTLGYRFKPWTGKKAIADGPSIWTYLAETAVEQGIEQHIRFGHRLLRAEWSSALTRWRLEVLRDDGTRVHFTCRFLIMCTGYYSYAEGHRPAWAGEERFRGQIIHPQFWPEDLDYSDKRVLVIGSGATAYTLVPEMAKRAAHVVMLQRSPTYVVSRPSIDNFAERLKRLLPLGAAYALVRWKNALTYLLLYRFARKQPKKAKQAIMDFVRAQLGPAYDVEKHFNPVYAVWDQRVCIVPDADIFKAIRSGFVSVVTDTIDTFTERGVRLSSGTELEADIVVTATGLKLNVLGDVAFRIDGLAADLSKTMSYKSCMLSGVPNLVYVFGYTNASWTLKADLTSEYICRLLKRMDARGASMVVVQRNPAVPEAPLLSLTSGYVQRASDKLPKQGSQSPWKLYQNYVLDLLMLRFGKIADGTLQFEAPRTATNLDIVQTQQVA